jgi:hypothetical protein
MVNETQRTNEATTDARSSQGNERENNSLIGQANTAAERIEKAREELKRENDRREALLAQDRLGGTTGYSIPAEKPKPTAKEYADAALRGVILK